MVGILFIRGKQYRRRALVLEDIIWGAFGWWLGVCGVAMCLMLLGFPGLGLACSGYMFSHGYGFGVWGWFSHRKAWSINKKPRVRQKTRKKSYFRPNLFHRYQFYSRVTFFHSITPFFN